MRHVKYWLDFHIRFVSPNTFLWRRRGKSRGSSVWFVLLFGNCQRNINFRKVIAVRLSATYTQPIVFFWFECVSTKNVVFEWTVSWGVHAIEFHDARIASTVWHFTSSYSYLNEPARLRVSDVIVRTSNGALKHDNSFWTRSFTLL